MSKKSKAVVDLKESKTTEMWIPIGLMIGTVVGFILSFDYDDMMFVVYGSVVGLLFGAVLGSILSQKNIKIELKKKKKNYQIDNSKHYLYSISS